MGRKGRGGRAKAAQAPDASAPPIPDRGALAQCLNATSQIAAECNSILRDLLRGRSPQHQDLQRLASQVLMGQTMNLQELQKKMESQQATLAELLKVLKPAAGSAGHGLVGADATYALPEPSLSVIKGWDSYRESYAASGGAARRQRRSGKGHSSGGTEGMSKRDRYSAVEAYWRSLTPEARRAVLVAPVCRLLEAARSEGGEEAAREVSEGLALLKHSASRHACVWRCPCCNVRTPDPTAFVQHVQRYHEEVQYLTEDTPMLCVSCGQEVVGAYYHSGEATGTPTAVCCLRCAWEARGSAPAAGAPAGMRLRVPEASPLLTRSWSGSYASTTPLTATSGSATPESFSSEDHAEEEGTSRPSQQPLQQSEVVEAVEAVHPEVRALEARVRSSPDGLQAAVIDRIDAIERADRKEFELALTGLVQQAQRLMSGLLAGADGQERSPTMCEARRQAAARLQRPEQHPDQAAELRAALCLLSSSELQDLLALLARLHSPAPERRSGTEAPSSQPNPASYEPACVALLHLQAAADAEAAAGGAVVAASEDMPLPAVADDEEVCVHQWWVDHLVQKSWEDLGVREDTYLLQWLYGCVAHGATEEFLERQRLACGGKSQDMAVADALAEVAETWRHLAATMDRKRHVTALKEAAAEDMEAVDAFEGAGLVALRSQAAEFFEDIAADPQLSVPPPPPPAQGGKPADPAWSQRALAKLQRYHQLKDESSIRYAQALLDREIAVLELAELMNQHECDVAEREMSSVDSALGAARADLADAEGELARARAEGPAAHRKRDLLDKVNKEAEHRERTGGLHAHITACKERIASEEAFGAAAGQRRNDAATDLTEVRQQLHVYLERRATLDAACADVLAAQERDRGQELTDAYVDARIRAVWQVVTGVADSICRLHKLYAPGHESVEAARHARSTSLANSLSAELDDRIRVWWDDLDKLRHRTADLACTDGGQAVEAAALEAARRRLEAAAAAAREAATLDLLRELEAEEAARKAVETKKARKKAGKAAAAAASASSGQAAAAAAAGGIINGKDGGADASGASEDDAAKSATGTEGDSERQVEVEYEAALERRRRELERQEADRVRQEAELVRLVQETSLREQAAAAAAESKAGGRGAKAQPVSGQQPGKGSGGATAAAAVAAPPGLKSPEKVAPRVVLVHRPVPTTRAKAGKDSGSGSVPPPPPPPGKPVVPGTLSVAPGTKDAAAGGGGGGSAESGGEMRIISFYGDWSCFCGRINRLWDTCTCGQVPPCRDWVRGRCTYKDRCRFHHPPFELPDTAARPKSPIAKPGPDAVVYRKSKSATQPKPLPSVSTPDARPVAAPKSATLPAPAAAAAAKAAPAPPPLKLAPWASVRPGTAVTGPSPAAATGPSPLDSMSGGAPAASPPATQPPPQRAAPPAEVTPTLPASPAVPARALPTHGFDLFGSNPLITAFMAGGSPQQAQQHHQMSSGDSLGGLGLGGLGPPSPQLAPPSASHLFGSGGDPGSGVSAGFLGALSAAHAAQVSGAFPAPQASLGSYPGSLGGSVGPLSMAMPDGNRYGSGGMGGLSANLSSGLGGGDGLGHAGLLGPGAGLGSLGGHNGNVGGGGGGVEEWGDLELQLPSDLGEILGESQAAAPSQMHPPPPGMQQPGNSGPMYVQQYWTGF